MNITFCNFTWLKLNLKTEVMYLDKGFRGHAEVAMINLTLVRFFLVYLT